MGWISIEILCAGPLEGLMDEGWALAYQWFFLTEPAASPSGPSSRCMAEPLGTLESCRSTFHATPANLGEDSLPL